MDCDHKMWPTKSFSLKTFKGFHMVLFHLRKSILFTEQLDKLWKAQINYVRWSITERKFIILFKILATEKSSPPTAGAVTWQIKRMSWLVQAASLSKCGRVVDHVWLAPVILVLHRQKAHHQNIVGFFLR